jgi:hypothetical protein
MQSRPAIIASCIESAVAGVGVGAVIAAPPESAAQVWAAQVRRGRRQGPRDQSRRVDGRHVVAICATHRGSPCASAEAAPWPPRVRSARGARAWCGRGAARSGRGRPGGQRRGDRLQRAARRRDGRGAQRRDVGGRGYTGARLASSSGLASTSPALASGRVCFWVSVSTCRHSATRSSALSDRPFSALRRRRATSRAGSTCVDTNSVSGIAENLRASIGQKDPPARALRKYRLGIAGEGGRLPLARGERSAPYAARNENTCRIAMA